MNTLPSFAAVLVVLVACASSSPEPAATVHGTVGGATIDTTDAIGLAGSIAGTNNTAFMIDVPYTLHLATVLITNLEGGCGLVQNAGNAPGATVLTVTVQSLPALAVGTYPVNAPGEGGQINAVVSYATQDAACASTTATAQSGSITLSTLTATRLAGTFDATFPDGNQIAGTFDVPVCDATADAWVIDSTKPCGK